jgi:putative transposase
LTRGYDEQFDAKVADICGLYGQAQALATVGERVLSTDELTGVQALERKHPDLPLVAGKVMRREFEYIRHGTRSFILSRDVLSGKLIAPYCAATRKEEDFLAHIKAVVSSNPETKRWHFVVDNLDTHRSASLVALVTELSGLDIELGEKGKSGVLTNRP